MISASLKKAACMIVLVLCPNPISSARAVALIMNNLAPFLAKSFLTLAGISFTASSGDQIQLIKKDPPFLIPEVISYRCK